MLIDMFNKQNFHRWSKHEICQFFTNGDFLVFQRGLVSSIPNLKYAEVKSICQNFDEVTTILMLHFNWIPQFILHQKSHLHRQWIQIN